MLPEDFIRDIAGCWKSALQDIPEEYKRSQAKQLLQNAFWPLSLSEDNQMVLVCSFPVHAEKMLEPENFVTCNRIMSHLVGREVVCTIEVQQPRKPATPAISEQEQQEEQKKRTEKRRREIVEALLEDSHLPQLYKQELTFETFEAKTEIQKRALAAAKEFSCYEYTDEQWETSTHYWSLTLHGPCGTGKTHLAVAIALYWIGNELPSLFWNVPDLLTALRRGFQDDSYFELLERVRQIDVLVLDDLGMEKTTDWASEQIDAIIECRYRNKRDTVVTTNLSFSKLPRRVASRLSEGITVCVTGNDYRALLGMGKAKKRKQEADQ